MAAGGSAYLLARYAEAIFWLARYVERAENLARILDVQETFARDVPGDQTWLSIVQINSDDERFAERYRDAGPASVIDFYLMDKANPNSILSSVRAARENARTLRPLISTEMWTQLNIFYNQLRATGASRLAPSELPRLCAMIKESCQTHTGITEGTLYRDQGWHFYQLGRVIERADQTSRILDIKYHTLLPRTEDVGTLLDLNQWHSLLRSVAGYHAYRRRYPSRMNVSTIVRFLIGNGHFPRSLRVAVKEANEHLMALCREHRLAGAYDAASIAAHLAEELAETRAEEVIASGLHEYLDRFQLQLMRITNAVSAGLFAHDTAGGETVAA